MSDEKKRKHELAKIFMNKFLGAIYGWGYDRKIGYWSYVLLYWYERIVIHRKTQYAYSWCGLYLAGHTDWTRGRHWDRRKRYGIK